MTRLLIFDTETTGLFPKYFNPTEQNIKNDIATLPYIVQFSCILFETKQMRIIDTLNEVVKLPDEVNISQESINVHGITRAKSNMGVSILECIDRFNELYNAADIIVAHNFKFDAQMIKVECVRNDKQYFLGNTQKTIYCTMQNSIDLCNIIVKNKLGDYKKFPKLEELHEKLFQMVPHNLHDSYHDILITLRCFLKMSNNIDVFEKNVNIKKYCEVHIM